MKGAKTPSVAFVLPSLKISGGVLEALGLAKEVASDGSPTVLYSVWRSPHPVSSIGLPIRHLSAVPTRPWRAALGLPRAAWRFAQDRRSTSGPAVFTHYATLPLAGLVSTHDRWVFVQDLEWHFAHHPVKAWLLRKFIVSCYGRCRLIAANSYLQQQLTSLGFQVEAVAPVWADVAFDHPGASERDIDVAMVLRKGAHKRLDLYLALLQALASPRGPHRVRTLVITTEDDIAERVRGQVHACLLRPELSEMRDAYARSRCFVHLSEHEGFGLPPLEAMGAGCVPYCRDSGGVRAYMQGELGTLLVDRARGIDAIADDLRQLCADGGRLRHLSGVAKAQFCSGKERAVQLRAQAVRHLQRAREHGAPES